jgi:predicted  nucleic acid-binding Zn-ribbon protein
MEPKNNLFLRIGLSILIISLIGIGIYFYFDNQKLEKEKKTLEETKIELQNEIKELDAKITELETVINDKNTEIETKDRKVNELQNEIVKLQNLVKKYESEGKITKIKAEQLQGQLDQKNYYLAKYQQEINRLKEENQKLKTEIENLNNQIGQKDSLNQVLKEDLSYKETKLEAASILKASDFVIYNINTRGKEIPDDIFKSRQLHNIKICFKINENYVANPGIRTIYVQIVSPNKEILKQFKNNSGYFTYRNREEVYSTKVNINFQNVELQACAIFNKPDDLYYEKGEYKVIVYSEGYEIGKTNFTVK